MNKLRTALFFSVAFIIVCAGEPVRAEYIITADSIYRHIAVLAHDSLEGRQVGEIGEQKAARYIQEIFTAAGLEPKGADGGYLQPFDFVKRIDLGENNRLTVNGTDFRLNEEFVPMQQSASIVFDFPEIVDVGYGFEIDDDDGVYNDYEGKNVAGKAVLIKRYGPVSEDSTGIDFDKYSTITDKVNAALGHDVAGVFLITPEEHDDTMLTAGPVHINPKDVPVIWLRRKGLQKLGLDLAAPEIISAAGQTELYKTRDTGYNVVGYVPTGNDTTVIIGAHYDHLGWGTAASRYTGEEKMIHNGADDNASGTACLLELARYYSTRRNIQNYSTLFIAFSGEEEGILGSTNFARDMTIDSSKVRMMVNIDMVGRLKEQEKGLAIFGTGTCQEFKGYFDSLSYDDVELVSKVSGIGGSDHTAFYNRHIPVLNFFTGAHEDYHKPSDDLEKIDLEGAARVANIVADVVNHFDGYGAPLVFQRTKSEEGARHRARYSVTLGIIPDFVSEVVGLRVDGVSPDRPGDRAGLREGDIIIRMGETVIGDIYDYMSILGKFRKGDSTRVVVERGQDTLQLEVIFE
ncbi:MAG: M28 family peptidase [candidate division Zixibacteria bacterium]|nr:M28 family peptidase [candidate division Zixibacteria bacterium]